MITPEQLKAIKKRGHYFTQVIDIPMAKKYNISRELVNEIRRLAIHKKLNQQEICIKITKALNDNLYQVTSNSRYSLEKLISLRTHVLRFLLRCSAEAFAEITQLTKYDWDYAGEDKKMPPKSDYLEYLHSSV